MNASPVPAFGMVQPLTRHSSTFAGTAPPNIRSTVPVYPGPGMGVMPPGQKFNASQVPSHQMLHPNQAPGPGDSATLRTTLQPPTAFSPNLSGSFSQGTSVANGLSAAVSGDAFNNRSNSTPPNLFQTNGPPMPMSAGILPGLGSRQPTPGSAAVVQPLHMVRDCTASTLQHI